MRARTHLMADQSNVVRVVLRAVIAYGVAISLSLQYKQVVSLVNDICTFAFNVEFPLGQESFQPATLAGLAFY